MSEAESTSVDVLIARLESHPDEFFCREAVSAYDGARIFADTKWRRISTSLMVDKNPGEQNLWMDLFTPEERDRFRTAMYKALRSELDTQIMRVLVGEDPFKFNPEGQAMQQKQAAMASQMAMHQALYGQNVASGRLAAHPGGLTLGTAAGGTASSLGAWVKLQNDEKALFDQKVRLMEEADAKLSKELLDVKANNHSLMKKVKSWF